MAVSTTPQPPGEFRCALVQLFLAVILGGQLSLNPQSMVTISEDQTGHAHGAFNELLGLRIEEPDSAVGGLGACGFFLGNVSIEPNRRGPKAQPRGR